MFEPVTAAVSAVFHPQPIETRPSDTSSDMAPNMAQEILPFTVRVVRNAHDLSKAVDIRHHAYARHLPDFAESLKSPEAADTEDGVIVLLAESKLDGSPLGTMRIQTNEYAPLCLEQSITLPLWLKSQTLAEATRLGVTDGRGGRLITTVLFKAFYLYCKQQNVDWMVVTGRAPVDRMYDRMLFADVIPGMGYVPFSHVGNLLHRVMSLKVDAVEPSWAAAKQPLYDFFFHTSHPDIQLSTEATQEATKSFFQSTQSDQPTLVA